MQPADILRKARTSVGSEAAIDAFVTLQIQGRIVPEDVSLPAAEVTIVARRPLSQRVEVRTADLVETTILRGKRGCLIRASLSDPDSRHMRELNAQELAIITGSTREIFAFYRPDAKSGETLKHGGIVEHRGQRVHRMEYRYPDGRQTLRYFAVCDGNLVSLVTHDGLERVDIGEQIVGGLNFPERIEYYQAGEKLHTMHLLEVAVNKPLKQGAFSLPKPQQ